MTGKYTYGAHLAVGGIGWDSEKSFCLAVPTLRGFVIFTCATKVFTFFDYFRE